MAGSEAGKMTSSALNINLIIPFKDNKGDRLKLVSGELERFGSQLEGRVAELKDEIDVLFSGQCSITIAGRSDGNSKKYYWRFKSNKKDRKYNRLHAKNIIEYLSEIAEYQKLRLKDMESELILINANFKLIKGAKDAIVQSQKETQELLEMAI